MFVSFVWALYVLHVSVCLLFLHCMYFVFSHMSVLFGFCLFCRCACLFVLCLHFVWCVFVDCVCLLFVFIVVCLLCVNCWFDT